jgi:hypothetical protein
MAEKAVARSQVCAKRAARPGCIRFLEPAGPRFCPAMPGGGGGMGGMGGMDY